jgi:hypothetical protein
LEYAVRLPEPRPTLKIVAALLLATFCFLQAFFGWRRHYADGAENSFEALQSRWEQAAAASNNPGRHALSLWYAGRYKEVAGLFAQLASRQPDVVTPQLLTDSLNLDDAATIYRQRLKQGNTSLEQMQCYRQNLQVIQQLQAQRNDCQTKETQFGQ